MVSSLDGYIAKTDNSISWFETSDKYEKGVASDNPEEFLKTIDCYVMGSRTYELALKLSKDYGWPYSDKPAVVLTSRTLPNDRPHVTFYNGSLDILVKEHLQPRFKNVWLVGGSSLARDFIRQDLVSEIRINILPIMLGEGLPFFDNIGKELNLHLKDVTAYKNGMVELQYELKNQE